MWVWAKLVLELLKMGFLIFFRPWRWFIAILINFLPFKILSFGAFCYVKICCCPQDSLNMKKRNIKCRFCLWDVKKVSWHGFFSYLMSVLRFHDILKFEFYGYISVLRKWRYFEFEKKKKKLNFFFVWIQNILISLKTVAQP
jgi:hypothetical protein